MSNVLLGTAISDALGMPFETKLPNNPDLLAWDGKTFLPSEHHGLVAGQWTDDTQMSLMVAESLISQNGFDPADLSQRYVEWITSGRARGYGKTTLLAVHNLMEGKHWSESGVAGSYGNGTAMRAAPFGVYFRNDYARVIEYATVDAEITHASDEAIAGSIAIALATAYAINNDTEDQLIRIHQCLPSSKVKDTIYSLSSLVDAAHISPSSALAFLGTKADVRQTVPAALYCFMKFKSFTLAIEAAIRGGGDTDTTAAITGALIGARGSTVDMHDYWIDGVEDSKRLIVLDSQLYNRSNTSFLVGVHSNA